MQVDYFALKMRLRIRIFRFAFLACVTTLDEHTFRSFFYNFYCDFLIFSIQCHRLDGGLSKLLVASDQLAELNEKLAIQKVAVTEKSEACEKLLAEISQNTGKAIEKKQMAEAKKEEIAEQNKLIVVEKVRVRGGKGGG